jgi:hypothetical protein
MLVLLFLSEHNYIYRTHVLDFYSILSHGSAFYFNQHHLEMLVTKRVKGKIPLLTNSGYKVTTYL